MISTILFDIGGVFLHQPEDTIEAGVRDLGLTAAQVQDVMYGPIWERYKRGQLSEDACWAEIFAQLPDSFCGSHAVLRERMDFAVILDESLVRLVEELRLRYRIAALSNAGAELERRLEELHIDHLFEHVINSHRVKMAKPDEAIYLHTASVLGVGPESILFVDDKPRNTIVADKLGLSTHVYTTVKHFQTHLQEIGLYQNS